MQVGEKAEEAAQWNQQEGGDEATTDDSGGPSVPRGDSQLQEYLMPDIYRIATICAYGLAGALFAILLQTCTDAHYWDTRPWTSLFVSAGIPLSLTAALSIRTSFNLTGCPSTRLEAEPHVPSRATA